MTERRERKFKNGQGKMSSGKSMTSWTHRNADPRERDSVAAAASGHPGPPSVFVKDPDLTLYQGDALEVLRTLPAESVHCVVTSPPYWGLRDYSAEGQLGLEATPEQYLESMVAVFREVRRVLRSDGTCWVNMGDSYLAAQGGRQSGVGEMPAKPLKRDGRPRGRDDVDTGSWADGDVTAKMTPARGTTWLKPKDLCMIPARLALALQADGWWLRSQIVWSKPNPMPESVTDRPTTSHEFVYLLTKFARYFFDQEAVREPHRWQDPEMISTNAQARQGARLAARRAAGDTSAVRTQEPWNAAMRGERAKGRGTDVNKESELAASPSGRNVRSVWTIEQENDDDKAEISVVVGGELVARIPVSASEALSYLRTHCVQAASSRPLVRSVWEIPTQPYPEAHFATYPEELVRRCILAGSSERGCCPECGAPWTREVERELEATQRTSPPNKGRVVPRSEGQDRAAHITNDGWVPNRELTVTTIGWRPSCECYGDMPNFVGLSGFPCTVLDPFFGSGTTGLVARKHGRRTIGIELSPDYCRLAARRLQQLSLLAEGV